MWKRFTGGLEAKRREVLLDINAQKTGFEEMMQRANGAGEDVNTGFVSRVLERFGEIEKRARERDVTSDELDSLRTDAEYQGQLEAYICPKREIADEGALCIDAMEEWNVPPKVIARLRAYLGKKLEQADMCPDAARSSLKALFEERDSWADYTDDYEDTMKKYGRWIFGLMLMALALAVAAMHFSVLIVAGLVFAGIAGSCVSVMMRVRAPAVTLSGDLDAYGRGLLNRIGVGIAAGVIGCAALEWGLIPISIQGQTFPDLLNACAVNQQGSCTEPKILILVGIPMLFALSERALTSFEQTIFGRSERSRARR